AASTGGSKDSGARLTKSSSAISRGVWSLILSLGSVPPNFDSEPPVARPDERLSLRQALNSERPAPRQLQVSVARPPRDRHHQARQARAGAQLRPQGATLRQRLRLSRRLAPRPVRARGSGRTCAFRIHCCLSVWISG